MLSPVWPLPARGERIQLRRLRPADTAAFQAYRSDPIVGRYQGWEPMTDQRAVEFIASMVDVTGPVMGDWIQLAIALNDDDSLIGDAGIHLSADGRQAELGLSLARLRQGQGLASEAFALLIAMVFRQSGCESIRGVIDAENTASIRLVQRHGFEQIDRVETVFRGAPCTEVIFRLRNPGRLD